MALISCKKCDYTFNDDEKYCPRCNALNRDFASTAVSKDEQRGLTRAKKPGQIDFSTIEIESLEELEKLTRPDEPVREFADIAPPDDESADDIVNGPEAFDSLKTNETGIVAGEPEEVDVISFFEKTEAEEPDVITEAVNPEKFAAPDETGQNDEAAETDAADELLELEGPEEESVIAEDDAWDEPLELEVAKEEPEPAEDDVLDEALEFEDTETGPGSIESDAWDEPLELEGAEDELRMLEDPAETADTDDMETGAEDDNAEAESGYRFRDSDEDAPVATSKAKQPRRTMVTAHQPETKSPLKLLLLILLLVIVLGAGYLSLTGKLFSLFGDPKPLTVTETINRMNPDKYLDSVEAKVMEAESMVKSEPINSPQQIGQIITAFSECLEYIEPGFKLTFQPDQASRFQRLQDYLGGVQAQTFPLMRQAFAALFMAQPQMQQWRDSGVNLYCIGDNLDILRFVAPGVENEPGTSQVLAQSMSGLPQLLRIKSIETSPDNLQILEWTDIDSFKDKDLIIWDKEVGTLRNMTTGQVKELAGISSLFTGSEQ